MISRKRSTLQIENKVLFVTTILNRIIEEATAEAEYNIYQKGAANGFMEVVDSRASILQTVIGLIYTTDSLQSKLNIGSDTEPQPSTFDNQIYGKVTFMKLPSPKAQVRLTRADIKHHLSIAKATKLIKREASELLTSDHGSVVQSEGEHRQNVDSQSEIPNSNSKRGNKLVPIPLPAQPEDAEDKSLALQHYIKTKSIEVATTANNLDGEPIKVNVETERIKRGNVDFSRSNISKPKDDKFKAETRSLFYQSK